MVSENKGNPLLVFFSLYSRRSFLLISLAFENPLSITFSLYPRFFKWWRKSASLCLMVSTVEHIRFILMAWLNGILLKQCLGWQLLCERYWSLSVGLEYKSVVMLPSLTVMVVTRKAIFGFWHFVCQLSHLARALANFRPIFSPSLKDAVPILRINFYRISLWNIAKIR